MITSSARSWRSFVIAFSLAFVASSACTKDIRIQLGEEGFECVSDQNSPLAWRALPDAGIIPADLGVAQAAALMNRLSSGDGAYFRLVLDIIPVPAGTPALLAKIVTACNGGYCPPSVRRCYEVDALHGGFRNGVASIDDFVGHIAQAAQKLGNLPGGTVVVRAVGTTDECADLVDVTQPFDRDHLVGCDISAPQTLTSIGDVLTLDLNVAGHACYCQVQYCAGVTQIAPECVGI